jgi:hypothetical protein
MIFLRPFFFLLVESVACDCWLDVLLPEFESVDEPELVCAAFGEVVPAWPVLVEAAFEPDTAAVAESVSPAFPPVCA